MASVPLVRYNLGSIPCTSQTGAVSAPVPFVLEEHAVSKAPEPTPQIIIPDGANVWPHELETAMALARAGLSIRFIRRSEERHATSADVIIDGEVWEMKAPTSSNLKVVEKNLRRAMRQSRLVIFDSRRMKQAQDFAVERELRKWAAQLRQLKRLKFVNKRGEVIDIK